MSKADEALMDTGVVAPAAVWRQGVRPVRDAAGRLPRVLVPDVRRARRRCGRHAGRRTVSGNVPMSQSSGHDRCGWDVEYGQLCTVTPGVLTPTANLIVLCPPEQGCTDAVAHRADGTGWHTASGGGIADWYARHAPVFEQLTLDVA